MNEVPNRANHPNRVVVHNGVAMYQGGVDKLGPQPNLSYIERVQREAQEQARRTATPENQPRPAKPTSYDGPMQGAPLKNPYTYTDGPAQKTGKIRGMLNKIKRKK